MSTFTIRVTSSATNAAGTGYGQQPDLGAPSFWDMIVSGSTNPLLPNGVYDAYCLDLLTPIGFSPTSYSAQNYAGNTAASYAPIVFNSLTQAQADQINWVLAQNFTSDPKFGDRSPSLRGATALCASFQPSLAKFRQQRNRMPET